MIEHSDPKQKHDRLAAFLKAYGLRADYRDDGEEANLVIVDSEGAGEATHLIYRPRAAGVSGRGMTILAAATIDFGENLNPLVGALPEELCFGLASERELQGLADLIVGESIDRRCGCGTIHARLCEVIVVLAIRKALAAGTVNAGLLAGLAHRQLHPSLVAMRRPGEALAHWRPGRNYRHEAWAFHRYLHQDRRPAAGSLSDELAAFAGQVATAFRPERENSCCCCRVW